MANLKFVIRKDKKRADGTVPIFLRITGNGATGYISTKLYINPKQWDAVKQRFKKNGLYNKRLDDFRHKIEKVNGYDKSFRDIKTALRGNGDNDFVEYARGVIESIRNEDQYWNAKNLETALNKLLDFDGASVIPFSIITPEYIRNFKGYLHKINNKTNTITKTLGSLKRIFNQAMRERKISRENNPFTDVKLIKEKANKEKLTDAEIQRIQELNLPEHSLLWNVRNYFMFSFFCGGMRFIDLAHLKWDNINEGVLKYTMSKTDKTLEFELLPPAVQILTYYEPARVGKFVFPILPDGIEGAVIETQKKALSAKNALLNKYLVKIQKRSKVWVVKQVIDEKTGNEIFVPSPRLSMHIARHSFAYYAMRNGMTLFEIQAMLGHSSAVITETYLKSLSPESISTALKTAFQKYLVPGDKKILELAQ